MLLAHYPVNPVPLSDNPDVPAALLAVVTRIPMRNLPENMASTTRIIDVGMAGSRESQSMKPDIRGLWIS